MERSNEANAGNTLTGKQSNFVLQLQVLSYTHKFSCPFGHGPACPQGNKNFNDDTEYVLAIETMLANIGE